MNKAELERENYLLRQEIARLKRYYDKWAPLVVALNTAIRENVEDYVGLENDD